MTHVSILLLIQYLEFAGQELQPKVAFYAAAISSQGPNPQDTAIIFDRIFTSIGNAYDGDLGHFAAPITGTYQFYWSVNCYFSKSGYAIGPFFLNC